jgi:hypothetical protein
LIYSSVTTFYAIRVSARNTLDDDSGGSSRAVICASSFMQIKSGYTTFASFFVGAGGTRLCAVEASSIFAVGSSRAVGKAVSFVKEFFVRAGNTSLQGGIAILAVYICTSSAFSQNSEVTFTAGLLANVLLIYQRTRTFIASSRVYTLLTVL